MQKVMKKIGSYFPRHKKSDLEKKYDVLDKIGTGNFSVVKKCKDRETGKLYALKIIDKKLVEGKEEMIETEVEILRRVKHPNIISMVEAFDTEDKLYLVMDLATGGELFDRIVAKGSYTEKDASKLVKSILEATQYLHSLDIVHRDLKPENLLFSDPSDEARIMITDFGLSKLMNEDDPTNNLKTACGTPGYVAPEVLRQRGYGKEVDLWSIGVIAYILLCGYPPFYHEDQTQLFELILRGRYEFHTEYWSNISDSAKDLVKSLLTVDPAKRSTPEIALKHPWIAGEEASTKNIMDTFKEGLKKNPRERLRAAVAKVQAMRAFRNAMGAGKDGEEVPEASE